jgi:hypothetical protein
MRAGGFRLRMVRSDETTDPPGSRHSSLPAWKGQRPAHRAATLMPVDLQGQGMEIRELPRALREKPIHLR